MSEDRIPFPQEYGRKRLNALYREIPLKDTTSRMLRKYFNAMANLYGIIPLRKAWEIIHSQCPRMITEAEFLAFAKIARHECELFCILGVHELYTEEKETDFFQYEIIDTDLFMMREDLYYDTAASQQGKPYYVPGKQELLRYADSFYWEAAPAEAELAEFCAKKLKMEEDAISFLLLQINERVRYLIKDSGMPDLEPFGVTFASQKQLNEFLRLYREICNNGRMQCNRGHTPYELWEMTPPEQRVPKAIELGPNIRAAIASGKINTHEMRRQIFAMDLPNEELRLSMLRQLDEMEEAARPQKVSRNAPCPCGSGRKYKNCCGKNR